MIRPSRGSGGRRRRALVAVIVLVAGLFGGPAVHGQAPALCRITSADAFVYSDTPRGDVISYFAQAIMYTKDCGVSPAEVQATFRPVSGSPSTCDFRGTLLSDYALCRGAAGIAAPGTQVVIDAVGRTYGSGGADLFTSSCVVVVAPLPPGDVGTSAVRASCPLAVG
jgi:hypothetical protein